MSKRLETRQKEMDTNMNEGIDMVSVAVAVTDALVRPFATGPETLDVTKRQQAIEIMKSIPGRDLSRPEIERRFHGWDTDELVAMLPNLSEMFVDQLYDSWSQIPNRLSSNGRVKFRPGDFFLLGLVGADECGIGALLDVHLESGAQQYVQWREEVQDRLPIGAVRTVGAPSTISLSEIISDLRRSPDKPISIKIPIGGHDLGITDGLEAVRALVSES